MLSAVKQKSLQLHMAPSCVVSEVFNVKNVVTYKFGSKVTENDTIRSHTHDFLLTFHSNHRPISHRFRDKRWCKSIIANFPTPCNFVPPLSGFPLELGIGASVRKTGMMGYQTVEKVSRKVQPFKHNTGVWHPASHVATAIAALCYASREQQWGNSSASLQITK